MVIAEPSSRPASASPARTALSAADRAIVSVRVVTGVFSGPPTTPPLAVDTVGTPPFNRDIKEPATGPPITPPITRPIVADVMVRPITPRMP